MGLFVNKSAYGAKGPGIESPVEDKIIIVDLKHLNPTPGSTGFKG